MGSSLRRIRRPESPRLIVSYITVPLTAIRTLHLSALQPLTGSRILLSHCPSLRSVPPALRRTLCATSPRVPCLALRRQPRRTLASMLAKIERGRLGEPSHPRRQIRPDVSARQHLHVQSGIANSHSHRCPLGRRSLPLHPIALTLPASHRSIHPPPLRSARPGPLVNSTCRPPIYRVCWAAQRIHTVRAQSWRARTAAMPCWRRRGQWRIVGARRLLAVPVAICSGSVSSW